VPFTLPISLTINAPVRLGQVDLHLVTSSALVADPPAAQVAATSADDHLSMLSVDEQPSNRLEWTVPAVVVRVGPAYVHGAHIVLSGPLGLFRLRLYFPLTVAVRALPRAASLRGTRLRLPIQRSERDAVNPSARPVKGIGSDVRELREHLPGDPFKHIAWKATARRRRLIVKEFESDVSVSAYALLDVGPSMRWGPPGGTRLDAGIELTFRLARLLATGRDRFGMLSFDHDVFGFTRASSNNRMPQQVMSHLMELNSVVHEDFTELADDELLSRVARFMQTQESVDLSVPDGAGMADLGPWDEDAVVSRARQYLDSEHAQLASLRNHYFTEPSTSEHGSTLRTYCRLRGIDLPYRLEAVAGPRETGIERAIQKCITDRTASHTIIVITDLVGVRSVERLLPAVKLAKAHRHRLVVLSPDILVPEPGPELLGASPSSLEWRLRKVFSAEVQFRREQLARALRAQGVSVFVGDDPLRAMSRGNVFRAA
jgi:uncharacterized protein (DUF58 family)